jgi:hypothetical protein
MKYLKSFNEVFTNIESDLPMDSVYSQPTLEEPLKVDNSRIIYKPEWKSELPEIMSINYHNKIYKFKKGNIMLLGDMVEITYDLLDGEVWGAPDTLEFDIYFTKDNNSENLKINVDITYGDLMTCEFSVEKPNKVNVIQTTSWGSKFDPSNTVFALTDDSLDKFINFLNMFPDIKLSRNEMKFLDQYKNWFPS